MRNSIRKIASLCLAMAMILSVLAMPASAEEKSNHTHIYQTGVSYEYVCQDDSTHAYMKVTTYTCTYSGCTEEYQTYTVISTGSHSASGGGTLEYTFTDPETGATVYYYRYTCRVCGGSYIVERY